jgi:hypothetical protein
MAKNKKDDKGISVEPSSYKKGLPSGSAYEKPVVIPDSYLIDTSGLDKKPRKTPKRPKKSE